MKKLIFAACLSGSVAAGPAMAMDMCSGDCDLAKINCERRAGMRGEADKCSKEVLAACKTPDKQGRHIWRVVTSKGKFECEARR